MKRLAISRCIDHLFSKCSVRPWNCSSRHEVVLLHITLFLTLFECKGNNKLGARFNASKDEGTASGGRKNCFLFTKVVNQSFCVKSMNLRVRISYEHIWDLNNHFMKEVSRALPFESTYSAFLLERLLFKNYKHSEKYCSWSI